MKSPYNTPFSDACLTSVFAGFIATLLCMVYYLGYKEVTGFPLSILINVSSLIFIINLLFVAIGFIYYFFMKYSKKGEALFIILFVLITIISVVITNTIHRADDLQLNQQFHQLLNGLLIIIGMTSFIGIPFLFHNKKFHEEVL